MQNGYYEMRAAKLGHIAGDEARKSLDRVMGMCRMIESEDRVMGSLRFISDEDIKTVIREKKNILFRNRI